MKSFDVHYNKFVENINDIIAFIHQQEAQSKALLEIKQLDKVTREKLYTTIKQSVECIEMIGDRHNSEIAYNAVIISLYGAFENYIDCIFNDYLSIVSKNKIAYDQLSGKLKDKHLKRMGDYLSNPQRFKNIELTPEVAIKNAYYIMSNQSFDFKENTKLLLSHSGNLTMEQISNLSSEFGVNNLRNEITNDIEFQDYCCEKYDYSMETYKQLIQRDGDILFSPINQLVTYRNKVAHGNNDERISLSVVKDDIIPFVLIFSKLIKEILIKDIFCVLKDNELLCDMGYPASVFSNSIIIINNQEHVFRVGERILFDNDTIKKVLAIKSLEINKKSYDIIEDTNLDIGIGFEKCRKNNISAKYKCFCIKQ